jgi:hypothetical protein
MANKAFNAMQSVTKGNMQELMGRISGTEYEQNMSPKDQTAYENAIIDAFTEYYNSYAFNHQGGEPLSMNLWMKTVDPNNLEENAMRFADNTIDKQTPEYRMASIANKLQKLAHLHTGRIEDLLEIATSIESEEMLGNKQADIKRDLGTAREARVKRVQEQAGPLMPGPDVGP